MAEDTVEIFVAVVFEVYGVGKYLNWTLQKREPEVVRVNIGQRRTKSTLYHISYYDKDSYKSFIDKCLYSFTEPKLYLITMFKEQITYS